MGLKPKVAATLLTPFVLFAFGFLLVFFLANPSIFFWIVIALIIAAVCIGVWSFLYNLLEGK